jgi:hypothetical protein
MEGWRDGGVKGSESGRGSGGKGERDEKRVVFHIFTVDSLFSRGKG